MMCKYRIKARFVVLKTPKNHGRMYYGCPNYKRADACDFSQMVHMDGELYAETLVMNEALEAADLSRKVSVLEQSFKDARSLVNSLMDENELLRKMGIVEGLKDHKYAVECELIFRRIDVVLEELEKLRKI